MQKDVESIIFDFDLYVK